MRAHDLFIHADDGAFAEDVLRPILLFLNHVEQHLTGFLSAFISDLSKARIVLYDAVDDPRSPVSVQHFILKNQGDDVAVADEQLVLNHAERGGEADHEANRFEAVACDQRKVDRLDVSMLGDFNAGFLHRVQKVQFIVVLANARRHRHNFFGVVNFVELVLRNVVDVSNDVAV